MCEQKSCDILTKMNVKKFAIFLLALAVLCLPIFCEEAENGLESYIRQNPDHYKNALSLYEKLLSSMEEFCPSDSDFTFAIVFPEMMRYSFLRDELETFVTRILYTEGPESEGCSIGHFQMKPIFAEEVELAIAKDSELKSKYKIIDFAGDRSTRKLRWQRIKRIREAKTECAYICAFIDICKKKFSLQKESTERSLRILATAYNAGFAWNRAQIELIEKQNSYPSGIGNEQSQWNYGQIAFDFYKTSLYERTK